MFVFFLHFLLNIANMFLAFPCAANWNGMLECFNHNKEDQGQGQGDHQGQAERMF